VASKAKLLFERTAIQELRDAIQWYDGQRSGLGQELGAEVDDCIERIRANPQLYARVKKDYRRAIVHRFPFAVYFEFTADTVIVYSVFHSSRDPSALDRNLP
jgi:hypothetical protein